MVSTMALAVMLSAAGNIVNSFGYIIQKKAHIANRKVPEDVRRPIVCSGLWLCGFLVYGLGSGMHMAGLTFGPQSVLAAMDSLTLAANALLAPIFLDEKLHRRDIFATAAIIVGASIVVIFGPHANQEYDAEGIFGLMGRTPFVIYFVCVAMILLMVYVGCRVIEKYHKERDIEIDGDMSSWRMRYLVTAYSVLGGYFASQNELMAKSVGETLDTHFGDGVDQFDAAEAWMLMLLFICTNFLLEYWKQKALGLFGALYVIPIFQVSLVAFASVSGAVFFDEFKTLKAWEILVFFVGILIICLSIFALATYRPPDQVAAEEGDGIDHLVDVPERERSEELSEEGDMLIRRIRTSSVTQDTFLVHGKEEYNRRMSGDGLPGAATGLVQSPAKQMTPSRVPSLPMIVGTRGQSIDSMPIQSPSQQLDPMANGGLFDRMISHEIKGNDPSVALFQVADGCCPNLITDWPIGHRSGVCEDCGQPKAGHSRAIALSRVGSEVDGAGMDLGNRPASVPPKVS